MGTACANGRPFGEEYKTMSSDNTNSPEFVFPSPVQHLRMRPSMYIGSTDLRGLHQLAYILIEGAIDEWSLGWCKSISVELLADGGCCVRDDGAGVPVDWVDGQNRRVADFLLTDGFCQNTPPGPRVPRSLHYVSMIAVNALSKRLLIRFVRDGKTWEQEFLRGVPVAPLEAMCDAVEAGTCITFWPDEEIFKETCVFDHDLLKARLRELSYLFAGLEISFDDRRDSTRSSDRFHSTNGAVDFLNYLNRNGKPVASCVQIQAGEIDAQGRPSTVDCALQWMRDANEGIRAFANGYENKRGGTHLAGLRLGLVAAVQEFARLHPSFEKSIPTTAEIENGLSAILSVHVPEPSFVSAWRLYFCNPEATTLVGDAVKRQLTRHLETHVDEAAAILECIARSHRDGLNEKEPNGSPPPIFLT